MLRPPLVDPWYLRARSKKVDAENSSQARWGVFVQCVETHVLLLLHWKGVSRNEDM